MKNNMYKMVCRLLDGIYWQTVLLAIKGRWFDVWSWYCWVMALRKLFTSYSAPAVWTHSIGQHLKASLTNSIHI